MDLLFDSLLSAQKKVNASIFTSHVILSVIATGSALLLHLFSANYVLAAGRLWSRQQHHTISMQRLLTSERGMKRCCLTLSQSIWNTALHVAGCLTLRGWISLIVAKIKGRRFATMCSNFRGPILVPPHITKQCFTLIQLQILPVFDNFTEVTFLISVWAALKEMTLAEVDTEQPDVNSTIVHCYKTFMSH